MHRECHNTQTIFEIYPPKVEKSKHNGRAFPGRLPHPLAPCSIGAAGRSEAAQVELAQIGQVADGDRNGVKRRTKRDEPRREPRDEASRDGVQQRESRTRPPSVSLIA